MKKSFFEMTEEERIKYDINDHHSKEMTLRWFAKPALFRRNEDAMAAELYRVIGAPMADQDVPERTIVIPNNDYHSGDSSLLVRYRDIELKYDDLIEAPGVNLSYDGNRLELNVTATSGGNLKGSATVIAKVPEAEKTILRLIGKLVTETVTDTSESLRCGF